MEKFNKFNFCVGLLIRRHIRNLLDEAIFNNYKIEYFENKGLLSSTFTIKGDIDDINKIYHYFSKKLGELNKE